MASISLTLPVSGTQITAGLHSTNYGAIQTAINGGLDNTNIASGAAIAPSKLAGYPSDATKFLKGDGTWAAASTSAQLDRKTITADVSGIVATTEGTASAVITGNAVVYDGSEVKVDFWAPGYKNAGSTNRIFLVLLCDTTVIGQAIVMSSAAASDNEPIKVEAFHTPSAASHTYSVKAFVDSAGFAGTVRAGAGGAGNLLPAFLRVTKAA